MEEEQIKVNEIEKEEVNEIQQDPFELISEKFKEQEEKNNKYIRYIKTLDEEVKMLKSNFKLLLEEI